MPEPNSPAARKVAQGLWQKACVLTEGELILHESQKREPPGFWSRLKLKRAQRLLQQILALTPDHWNSMWLLGKSVQRFGDERAAFEWFVKAWNQAPRNADVAREAALSAMHLGLSRHAVAYCEEALKLEPNDPGLTCNLALALIHDGKPLEALAKAKLAVEGNPSDGVSGNVMRLAQHLVQSGTSCPRNSAELQEYCHRHRSLFSN